MNQPLRIAPMISAKNRTHSSLSFAVLSTRQREVMLLAAKGFKNKAIARELNVTEGTIKVHLHNVYEKLGVPGRSALAAEVKKLPQGRTR
jgi:two-component system nitrate/nitrite response regulator NarL